MSPGGAEFWRPKLISPAAGRAETGGRDVSVTATDSVGAAASDCADSRRGKGSIVKAATAQARGEDTLIGWLSAAQSMPIACRCLRVRCEKRCRGFADKQDPPVPRQISRASID